MAKPIQRDGFETVEEAGYGAVKGGLAGYVGSFIVGGLLAAGIAVGVAALGGGIIGGIGELAGSSWASTSAGGVAAAMFGKAGIVTVIAGLVGGGVSAATVGSAAAVGGALLGTAKGASKASKENRAFFEKQRAAAPETEVVQAHNEALQEGFKAGLQKGREIGQQEGKAFMVEKLQEAHQQLTMEGGETNHAARFAKKDGVDSHAELIKSQRDAQKAAGAVLGG